ncbi:hypothetical protein HX776_09880 [Pseudomonas agarici]|uniref:scabin-related ADP-ribosyltransferase n=1 Tax=Pseudomonas agarici TaxID=46677 RepID=UPI0008B2B05E|nr:hypothetical protein [Pseudomonas agarici]NWC09124.1 hypothetical protein [Pseudomonas agarici]SEK33888.1 Pertussis toxin, subunit 1 [Pseudomonas agarici]
MSNLIQSERLGSGSRLFYLVRLVLSVFARVASYIGVLLFCSLVLATPSEVYRVDERDPDEIFRDGFLSWGKNDYLLDHVLGASLLQRGDRGSFFVATTDNFETAKFIAQRRYHFQPNLRNRSLYIYTIRADQHFYEVDRYMESMESNPPKEENQRSIAEARRAYAYQREWVAAGGVPAKQISEAREVMYANEEVVLGSESTNAGYEQGQTFASEGIYPQHGIQAYHRIRQAYALNSTVEFFQGLGIGIAFCPPPPYAQSVQKITDLDGCMNPTVVDLGTYPIGLGGVYKLLLDED